MRWDQVRGHQDQAAMFLRAVARGRLSHAYLFVGPGGVGKKLFARTLAQCLFCQRFQAGAVPSSVAEWRPCGQCSSCKLVLAGTHPDLFVVGRLKDKTVLTLDVIIGSDERRGREGLCHDLSLRPMAGDRRIAIIDDAELMNEESANALLKTLEEPPPKSLLILISQSIDATLPTIRSRCQLVRFAPLPQSDLADLLLELELATERREAESVASLSDGSLSVAEQLLDPTIRDMRERLYQHLLAERFNPLAASAEVLAHLEEVGGETAAQRPVAAWIIRFCAEFFRQAVLRLADGSRSVPIPQAEQFAGRFNPEVPEDVEHLMELFDRTVDAANQLEWKTSIPLCLEALFHDLARLSRSFAHA